MGFCPEGAYVLMKLCMEGVLSKGFCPRRFCPRGFCPEGVLSYLRLFQIHMTPWYRFFD